MLRSETEQSRRVVKRLCAWHCLIDFYTLTLYLLAHVVEYLERFGSFF